MTNKIKVLFLSAEIAPLAKVGGLGDVAGSLPLALAKVGVDIRLAMPFYGLIDKNKYPAKKITAVKLIFSEKTEKCDIYQTILPGSRLPVYLIKHRFFTSAKIYCGGRIIRRDKYTRGYDDISRFAFFAKAALAATAKLGFQPDIIQANDWHTGLIADFIKSYKPENKFFNNTKTLYTVHNLANQGIADPKIIQTCGVSEKLATIKKDLRNGDLNLMAQGVSSFDFINTVSPSYAKEILTSEYGAGLEKILRTRKKNLAGILNGIDTDFFNPSKDKLIAVNYNQKTLAKKQNNKKALQNKLGLNQDKNIALIGLVSRFVKQKGINLITEQIASLNCQFVFLGTGQKDIEKTLKNLEKKYPDKIKVNLGFDEALAHQIYAGADIFLMPSLFEPCGLGQMIAMRYGTVPVVRATGGLIDTVKNFPAILSFPPRKMRRESILLATSLDPRIREDDRKKIKENGFTFKKFTSDELGKTLNSALDVYYNQPKIWRQLQLNGMREDFSWDKSAKEYLKLYKKLIKQIKTRS